MLPLVFLTVVGFCFAEKFDYRAEQHNATLNSLPDNPYIELVKNGSDYPAGIKYLMKIERTTPLMIRVIFGDEDGPLDAMNAEMTKLTLCDILDSELDEPQSAQRRYHMASSMGLAGERCPIEKGIQWIEPYNFPTRFSTKDLGTGERYYSMRMERSNQSLEDEPIMELRVHMNLEKEEGATSTAVAATTAAEEDDVDSASSILSLPSVIACLITPWLLSNLLK